MRRDLLGGAADAHPLDLVGLATLLANWTDGGAAVHSAACLAQLHGLDPGVSREHLRLAGLRRFAVDYYSPWQFADLTRSKPAGPSRATSLVLRAGSTMPIVLNGHATTAYLDQVRRVVHNNRPQHVKATFVIDTSKLPCTLDRETQCACLYCGSEPKGTEVSCRNCGAPLPNC